MKTIGEVLDFLENECKPDDYVWFDFAGFQPTTVESWRGIYAEPALGFEESTMDGVKVQQLVKELEDVINGKTFYGWKGGEFSYGLYDTLHIDNCGKCTNTEIRDLTRLSWGCVIINTCRESAW